MSTTYTETCGGASVHDVSTGRDFIGRDHHIETQINIYANSHLAQIWHLLDSDLQDALSLAYNQVQRDNKKIISTRYFFAALIRLQPGDLAGILPHIPQEVLPNPVDPNLDTQSDILADSPQLSDCIADSLSSLAPVVDQSSTKLSATDVFVDVAKHGTGPSVKKLHEAGITAEAIDNIIQKLGIKVVLRKE